MADESLLKILKQGVAAWNAWRKEASLLAIDLSGANLSGTSLSGADFSRADLGGADLSRADLSEANLRRVDLSGANLSGANLGGSYLSRADLSRAALRECNFGHASFRETGLANVDLSHCKGLELISHRGPSPIDIRTLQRSGPLPLVFLRGVGLPDKLIEYLPSLLNQAIQFYSCFISYSTKDEEFAQRLHADLQANGVRCWFAPEDLRIGAKHWDAIDDAIRIRDKLLLILSEASIASEWVEDEVNKAFAEERRRGRIVLFPVRVDDELFTTIEAWAAKLRDSRYIGDFRGWKDHDAYQKTLTRLLRDLRVESA